MGRKSMAKERRAQILDAFEECLLAEGRSGASVGAVAERAGVDRTLVHHYFGTRAALESALVERLVATYKQSFEDAVALLPTEDRPEALADYLFGDEFGDPRKSALVDELWAEAHRDPRVCELLTGMYREFEEIATAEVAKAFPDAPAERCRRVAYAMMCLSEASSGFVAVGFPTGRRRAAQLACIDLLQTLRPFTSG